MADFDREAMLDMFIFEITGNIEQLETTIVHAESEYNMDQINEIFRNMHTIKGSSAMMNYDNIAAVAHVIEDMFFYLREERPQGVDYKLLSDYVLAGVDFFKEELAKIQAGEPADGDGTALATQIEGFLKGVKGVAPAPAAAQAAPASPHASHAPLSSPTQEGAVMNKYTARIHFQDGCEMENIRAYTLVHNLQQIASVNSHEPVDVIDEEAIATIRRNGFVVNFSSTRDYEFINRHLSATVYLQELSLEMLEGAPAVPVGVSSEAAIEEDVAEYAASTPSIGGESPAMPDLDDFDTNQPTAVAPVGEAAGGASKSAAGAAPTANMISVNVRKLDDLLNFMGELVIAESQVTQNSELKGLTLDSFTKEARQLRKIIGNLQQTVMQMRMVPLSQTFFKMHRIVRDMNRALNKDVHLEIAGEETEVDKSIIEHLGDPIMHIIRNSLDHGVESPEERRRAGKPEKARVLLEAKNSGGDVLIIIKDDGRGINTAKVLKKARENGLTTKPDNEYTDKEIHQFIFLPGFSTNDQVTSYSGRGVGMDVVTSSLETVSGTAHVESTPGVGTTFTLKIPLTLSIIDGMSVKCGVAQFTIPIASIIKSFKATGDALFTDPNGNEMVSNRGEIFNIVRMHELFGIEDALTSVEDGTLVMLENGEQTVCLLVDELLGQQQAVVKPMPKYFRKVRGINGCTLLGNGDISLIIDVPGFFD